jgi:hypothetical protein
VRVGTSWWSGRTAYLSTLSRSSWSSPCRKAQSKASRPRTCCTSSPRSLRRGQIKQAPSDCATSSSPVGSP